MTWERKQRWRGLLMFLVCAGTALAMVEKVTPERRQEARQPAELQVTPASYLYGVHPGSPTARVTAEEIQLQNELMTASWSFREGRLRGDSLVASSPGVKLTLPEDVFALYFQDGRQLKSSRMRLVETPRVEDVEPSAKATPMAEQHYRGKRVIAHFEDPDHCWKAEWVAELRDGDNYIRQEVSFTPMKDEAVRQVRLIDFSLPQAQRQGIVQGSPVTAGNVFLGFEHPLSQCRLKKGNAVCFMDRQLPMKRGQTVSYSSVIGIAPAGQMRRAFLNYVERERAHPYRPFLHYNSWYDIGFGNPYDQAAALRVVETFGQELSIKRAVRLDSFLFDDGWDDPRSLWSFNKGFPDGFTPIREAAAAYSAAPGIWLSPWGGYAEAKAERLRYGTQQGYETNAGGFALSGPLYFARFRDVTLGFLRAYGINQFKIDGTGNVNSVFPHSEFDSDFHAAISLIGEWRRLQPDLFVNLTTGTYPSPFWLKYADSIWRGGEDHSFAGVGPWRERWITYRDADTYLGVVRRGPLFPLNSVMLHGIIYAQHAQHLADDPDRVFPHEVRSYFGTGTQLQEMYITAALLTESDWNVLAEAANWSRRNRDVLVDTHWLGGDPGKLEVYGWAAWSPEKGVLTLRNPSGHTQTISLDPAKAFELPPGAVGRFQAHSPWADQQGSPSITLTAGQTHTFTLAPFEVLTLEAVPLP